jgi:hypothetical protein
MFSIDSTSLDILDSKIGWSIKKDKGKSATLTQMPFKCTEIPWAEAEPSDNICIDFFAEKARWEEHVSTDRCYRWRESPNDLSTLLVITNILSFKEKYLNFLV